MTSTTIALTDNQQACNDCGDPFYVLEGDCKHCGLPRLRHALAHDNCKFVPTPEGGYQTTFEAVESDPANPLCGVCRTPATPREPVAGAWEVSTFQKRPAYKYVRVADKLPTTEKAIDTEDPIAKVKLFDPCGSWTWFICGYDPQTRRAWGVVKGHETEVGAFDLSELVAIRGRFGLPIERDLYWTPKPLSEVL